jgi:glycine betaine/proline transport system permease protein
MPSFVYLVPAIAFFSIGKVPGVLATVVFALPPMVRLTALGIQQVPHHIVEAAVAFGASPRQLLVKIELPLAIPSVMAGINQTIMMSLSMVVIAALIGAGGLGDHIVRALRHLETGMGLLAGIAIVRGAMILDRIVQASSKQRR